MSQEQHAETMVERRKYPRFRVKLNVRYQRSGQPDNRSFSNASISHDLGIGGLALKVRESLDVGQVLDLHIGLPDPEAVAEQSELGHALPAATDVQLTAKVVWRWPKEGSQYLVGIQFLDLEKEAAVNVKAFLQEYEMQDSNVEEEKRSALLSQYNKET